MESFFQKLEGGEIIGLVAIGGTMLCGIIAVISNAWRSMHTATLEASLKEQMIAKNMSAADIEKVLKASNPPPEA